MNYPDLINAAFEVVGGALCWVNVRRLKRDKETKGVYWPVSIFFAAWGLWNLYFYAALGQWASWVGGILLVSGNLVWVVMAAYYRRKHG